MCDSSSFYFLSQQSLSSVSIKPGTNKVGTDLQFKKKGNTFGVPLEILAQEATRCQVPFLVAEMVEYLEMFGKTNLFRNICLLLYC